MAASERSIRATSSNIGTTRARAGPSRPGAAVRASTGLRRLGSRRWDRNHATARRAHPADDRHRSTRPTSSARPCTEPSPSGPPAAGIARVHLLAFRDLDDPDAGGSEEHASPGRAPTSRPPGSRSTTTPGGCGAGPPRSERDGVRVLRHGGRVGVFPRTRSPCGAAASARATGIVEIFHGIPFFAPVWARRVPQVGLVHHVHLGVWHHLLPAPGRAPSATSSSGWRCRVVYRRRTLVTIAESSPRRGAPALPRRSRARRRSRPTAWPTTSPPAAAAPPTPLVLVVARLMPQKGLGDLLRAFAAARAAVPDARLVIVGAGPAAAGGRARAIDDARPRRRTSSSPGCVPDRAAGRLVPAGLGRRQRVAARGLRPHAHRGGRVRHARASPAHPRPRRRGRRRHDGPARRRRGRDWRRALSRC